MASLSPPPVQTAVDANGTGVSQPWLRWFADLFLRLSSVLGTYGSFCSTATQTQSLTNTALKVSLDTTTLNSSVTLASNKITVPVSCVCKIDWTAQVSNSGAGAQKANVWIRRNGADLANTAAQTSVGASGAASMAGGALLSVSAKDYIEFYWSVDATTVQLAYTAAGTGPAIPSFSASVTLISS